MIEDTTDKTIRDRAVAAAGILARTGLIEGRKATTHWGLQHMLSDAGSTYVPERWVVDDKYWTSAGVSAGMDMSLALIAHLYGAKRAMMTQLMVEYEPAPPFHSGSLRTAPAEIRQAVGAPMPSHA